MTTSLFKSYWQAYNRVLFGKVCIFIMKFLLLLIMTSYCTVCREILLWSSFLLIIPKSFFIKWKFLPWQFYLLLLMGIILLCVFFIQLRCCLFSLEATSLWTSCQRTQFAFLSNFLRSSCRLLDYAQS
jgi:hypothetical protein